MDVSLKICPKIIRRQSRIAAVGFVQGHFCWKTQKNEHNFSGTSFKDDVLNTPLFNN